MTGGHRTCWLALLAAAIVPAGCGQTSGAGSPQLSAVPLVGGTRVLASTRRCDRGANPFCAVQVVVVGGRYRSSVALMKRETRHLKALGWTKTSGDTGAELAADSPGHTLRLTYATAADDLRGADLNWIRRSPQIRLALSRAMFARDPALSLMLETGSS